MIRLMLGKQMWAGGRQNDIVQRAAAARGCRASIKLRWLANGANPALSRDWLVNNAQHGPAILQQGNQRAENRAAGDKACRAINGVQHPNTAGIGPFCAKFLANNAIARCFALQAQTHGLFRRAIRQCDGGGVGFAFQTKASAEVGANGISRRIGQGKRQLKV